jgi:hypothetical protein
LKKRHITHYTTDLPPICVNSEDSHKLILELFSLKYTRRIIIEITHDINESNADETSCYNGIKSSLIERLRNYITKIQS